MKRYLRAYNGFLAPAAERGEEEGVDGRVLGEERGLELGRETAARPVEVHARASQQGVEEEEVHHDLEELEVERDANAV